MNKYNRLVSLLGVCLSLCLPIKAMARGSDAYVGVSIGQATLQRQGNPDETDVGYKLFAGLNATGPFYAEVSHVNLGKFINDNTKVSGNALHLAGKLPFSSRLAALAKVGLFSWDVEYAGSNSSTTGTDASYGFAVTYILLTGQTLRFEWEHYSDVGQVNSVSGYDMSLASVGISFHF